MLRAILKDPSRDLKFSISRDAFIPETPQEVHWRVYYNAAGAGDEHYETKVSLPYEGSTHEAALMVRMGVRTLDDTWEEYKDLWYEDLEKQVAHLPRGSGP